METTFSKKVKQWTLGLAVATLGVTTMAMPSESLVAEAASVKKYETTDALNLRTGASVKNKRILTIPRGGVVQYVSSHNGWYKVKYAGKTGYASAKYLKQVGSTMKKGSTSSVASSQYIKKTMDVEVTAYTFNHGANITASGRKLQVGYTAAPREIPFGSIVDIPSIEKQLGVKQLTVYDRGGAIKRLGTNKIRIDVAFPSYAQAIKFGRKTYKNVPVYVKR